jgi:hypothetical protein
MRQNCSRRSKIYGGIKTVTRSETGRYYPVTNDKNLQVRILPTVIHRDCDRTSESFRISSPARSERQRPSVAMHHDSIRKCGEIVTGDGPESEERR